MKTATRRKIHVWLAVIFAIQVPLAIWAQFAAPHVFNVLWRTYLIFLSLYAVISTHWAGASAETPMDDEVEDRQKGGEGAMSEVVRETRETRETRPQPEPVETTETETEVETTEKTTETIEKEA